MSAPISLSEPRVSLPGGIAWPPSIAEELANLARLDTARWKAVTAANGARQALALAEQHDAAELADLLVDGQGLPAKRRRRTESAKQALDNAQTDLKAYNAAVVLSYSRLSAQIGEHRAALREQFGAAQRDAHARFERAASELDAAGRELVSFGGLLGMLEASDGTPIVRPWLPSAVVSIAVDAAAAALPKIRADVEATAAEPAGEPTDDDEMVEV